jgi:hypothetical protein
MEGCCHQHFYLQAMLNVQWSLYHDSAIPSMVLGKVYFIVMDGKKIDGDFVWVH